MAVYSHSNNIETTSKYTNNIHSEYKWWN